MVAKTGGVVVVPIVKQALSWIHCAFFATLLALNFSLVGTCKLFTIVHRGHSVLRARQLSWEEWSVVSCFELIPHYCGGSAQAVHRQCTGSAQAVHWEQGRVVFWALPKHGELPEFHCQLTSALQYPLPYRAFNTHCNMHCILKKKKNTTFDAYCYMHCNINTYCTTHCNMHCTKLEFTLH